jgi:hypothetical protein
VFFSFSLLTTPRFIIIYSTRKESEPFHAIKNKYRIEALYNTNERPIFINEKKETRTLDIKKTRTYSFIKQENISSQKMINKKKDNILFFKR